MKRSEEAGYRDYVTTRMEVMRRTAYLLCRDWHLADDLVSITIGKLYRHWPRASRVEHLDAYVRRILVRTWLDEKVRAWRREEPAETLPELPVLPDDDVVERLGLLELLDALPSRRRAAVVLRYYCDLSIEETAEILECSPGTVKSQTARGLESLRALVAASRN
ncbi:SigE family RNA polymerase sigma factor [Streptomyces sp. MN03-5084-2B]|nr:SigE family RNA polymerase sigma factor [Streptomyces sp. MN03-5084-2B]